MGGRGHHANDCCMYGTYARHTASARQALQPLGHSHMLNSSASCRGKVKGGGAPMSEGCQDAPVTSAADAQARTCAYAQTRVNAAAACAPFSARPS